MTIERIVTPTGRNSAGHRLYGSKAAAQLDLVRTLRDLGLDLAMIRRVLSGQSSLAEVAAPHADALSAQIRILCLRHAVLSVFGEVDFDFTGIMRTMTPELPDDPDTRR